MDDIEQLILQQMEEEEEEQDQEAVDHAVSVIALALVGHQLSHLYLCHGQLLPNPRIGTPSQALYDSRSDHARSLCVIIWHRYSKKKKNPEWHCQP
ncbi:hypothetical protein L208DRAFT_1396170 [Tricholoma matsutake]|nr:hypothetical protein L208DRAFT_1396170 [Tricholoma matsutake 945]